MKGSLRQRGKDPKAWSLVVDLGRDPLTGKRRQRWVSFRGTKRQAQDALAKLITRVNEGTVIPDPKITLAEYMDHWLNSYAAHDVAPKTYRSYEASIRLHIVPHIGAVRLRKLTPPVVQELHNAILAAGGSSQLVQHTHAVLRTALERAVAWGMIQTNPSQAVKPPRSRPREFTVMTPEELGTVLDALEGTRLWLPAFLAINTGMRRGEVFGLTWQHVDLSAGTLYVIQALRQVRGGNPVFRPTKTSGSRRGIAISERVVAALVRERARQAELKELLGTHYLDHNLVICRENGAPWDPDNFTHVFRLRVRQLGHERLRFHDLRHMHATLLIAGGVHAKVASARLGHSQIGITMNLYGHVIPGLDRQAVNVIDRALDKVSGPEG